MPNFNDSMKAKVAPAAINTGLDRPAGTGSTNDLLYAKWGGSTGSINDAGNTYFNTVSGPAFRSASTVTTQTTSLTGTIPSGVVAGDILIAHVRIKFEPKVGTQGDITYAGWTMRGSENDYYGGYWTATYSRTATGSDSSLTWTGGTNWHGAQMSIVALSGASDTLSGLVGASITAATSPTLLLGFWSNTCAAISGLGTLTPPASMTERVNSGFLMIASAERNNAMIATQTLTAPGATGTRTATVSNSAANFVQMIVVR